MYSFCMGTFRINDTHPIGMDGIYRQHAPVSSIVISVADADHVPLPSRRGIANHVGDSVSDLRVFSSYIVHIQTLDDPYLRAGTIRRIFTFSTHVWITLTFYVVPCLSSSVPAIS